jgi:hypothetical protein
MLNPLPPSKVLAMIYRAIWSLALPYMITTLQQKIDERISFLKEQINQGNKPEVNKTFQLQIEAISSVNDNIELIESIFLQKRALLKNSKYVHESDRLFGELDGLEWLQRQITVCSCSGQGRRC